MLTYVMLAIVALSIAFYALNRQRAVAVAGAAGQRLHSRPSYHGLYALLVVLIPALLFMLFGDLLFEAYASMRLHDLVAERAPDIASIEVELVLRDAAAISEGRLPSQDGPLRREVAEAYAGFESMRSWILGIGALAIAGTAGALSYTRIRLQFRARNLAETIILYILGFCAVVAILTTIGILAALIGETIIFFNRIDWRVGSFLFGTTWSPLSGVFEGNLDPARVGAVPLFLGTFLITIIALIVAVPIGLFSAIFLSEFATRRVRSAVKPLMEVLAGIPTVVYGFFAAITVAPLLRDGGDAIGLDVASQSALAAGAVMGIMIIPFVSSLSDDVINSVPQALRDASYGLGATRGETIRNVVLPSALPGIVSAVILAFSRAVGETMIVVMAAGQGANLTLNPFDAVTTVTVQIVTLITGDTEADTAGPPAFALGFTLFFITLVLNILALRIVRRYREVYE